MSQPTIVWAAAVGLLLTWAIEIFLQPRPGLCRPFSSWLIHSGLWCCVLGVLYALTGRVWFSTTNALALWLLIVLVSNAKFHSLREPFVCADFEYFSDALRFPRLYLPFFGIGKASGFAGAFLSGVAGGLYLEVSRDQSWQEAALLLAFGTGFLLVGNRQALQPSYEPATDLRNWGLAACLWRYFRAGSAKVDISALQSPFQPREQGEETASATSAASHPDLISVQSESFFDVRSLHSGIKPHVLKNFDLMCSESLAHGQLEVTAWGANTVRTEFAYLTGLSSDRLGVHRFNPYRSLARQGVPSIATALKRLGYRTVCVHPYAGCFYNRDQVLPALGFDEFIDQRAFKDSQRAGPFIADSAVTDKILALLGDPSRSQPLFIHAITMENHGPLHLEKLDASQAAKLFTSTLDESLADLGPYVRHIANADQMLGRLRQRLKTSPRPTHLCFFGDHVPIMPQVYHKIGEPDGSTNYLIWSNRNTGNHRPQPLAVEHLAQTFFEHSRQ